MVPAGGSGKIPDFLPNPRGDAALVDLDLAEQDRRWQARLAHERRRAEELRGQFVPRIARVHRPTPRPEPTSPGGWTPQPITGP